MNFPFFIAKRTSGVRKNTFSGLIIKIATIAIALSLAVMLIAVAFVGGFREEISKRVFGFDGHIRITNFDSNKSLEETAPVNLDMTLYNRLLETEGVKSVQKFAHRVGVLKNDETIEGIALKGIDTDFDWENFQQYMYEGEPIEIQDSVKSKKILMSTYTAKRLKLKIGDDVIAYFVKDKIKYRKYNLSGLYKTGLEEFDHQFALVDIKEIQRLNKWDSNQIGGLSVFVNDIDKVDEINKDIYYNLLDHETRSATIRQTNPGIFDWLELQVTNEIIILVLMIIVAVINMITALLILILERTNMIGILKALGAENQSIRQIFLIKAAKIIGIGMLLGNVLGLGLCFIQYYFEIITLPEESYYLSVAPVQFNWFLIIAINIGTFVIALLTLIIPSFLVSWINPLKAIRFD